MTDHAVSDAELTVACLCAAWCRTCDEYWSVFDSLQAAFGSRVRFAWIDIEDDEVLLGNVDVVDFPTLLISAGDAVAFFGPVPPHAHTLRQLIGRALEGALAAVADPALQALAVRIHARG